MTSCVCEETEASAPLSGSLFNVGYYTTQLSKPPSVMLHCTMTFKIPSSLGHNQQLDI